MLVTGATDNRPDYDYTNGCTLHVYELSDGKTAAADIVDMKGEHVSLAEVSRNGNAITVKLSAALMNAKFCVHIEGSEKKEYPLNGTEMTISL